jgi:hypothetical protein
MAGCSDRFKHPIRPISFSARIKITILAMLSVMTTTTSQITMVRKEGTLNLYSTATSLMTQPLVVHCVTNVKVKLTISYPTSHKNPFAKVAMLDTILWKTSANDATLNAQSATIKMNA